MPTICQILGILQRTRQVGPVTYWIMHSSGETDNQQKILPDTLNEQGDLIDICGGDREGGRAPLRGHLS